MQSSTASFLSDIENTWMRGCVQLLRVDRAVCQPDRQKCTVSACCGGGTNNDTTFSARFFLLYNNNNLLLFLLLFSIINII